MLYHLFTNLLSISYWASLPTKDLVVVIASLVLAIFVLVGLPLIARFILVPLAVLEGLFMSKMWACNGISTDPFHSVGESARAYCGDAGYESYLRTQFGIGHWYIWVGYVCIALYIIWPRIHKMYTEISISISKA